jgi:iron complex outermembrane receptor protein
VGAQGAITLTPGDQANLHRNSLAVYGDVGFNPVRRWFVDLAGRFEHYDDSAGNTVSGKFTTATTSARPSPCAAPSATAFAPLAGAGRLCPDIEPVHRRERCADLHHLKSVTPQSALGQALGARALKPERSLNISFGGTLKLAPPSR